jgi:RNA polymerase sigma-70 factor (ECF subfamily)
MPVALRIVPRLDPGAEAPGADGGALDAAREIELVARCQRGERSAFDELYRQYRQQVLRNLHRVLGPGADLEDTAQEVFIEVYRSIARFRGESRLGTWLYRVCANVAYHRIRTRKRKEPRSVELPPTLTAHGPDPERAASDRSDLAVVHRILEALAPKKRMVFVLAELEGLEVEEIAQVVGVPRVTVRTRLHYARKEFHALAAGILPISAGRSGGA